MMWWQLKGVYKYKVYKKKLEFNFLGFNFTKPDVTVMFQAADLSVETLLKKPSACLI